mgnify:CR=1 FL=1
MEHFSEYHPVMKREGFENFELCINDANREKRHETPNSNRLLPGDSIGLKMQNNIIFVLIRCHY